MKKINAVTSGAIERVNRSKESPKIKALCTRFAITMVNVNVLTNSKDTLL